MTSLSGDFLGDGHLLGSAAHPAFLLCFPVLCLTKVSAIRFRVASYLSREGSWGDTPAEQVVLYIACLPLSR